MTLRQRKFLWIAAVPLAAVSVCGLESERWILSGAMLCVAVGLAVLAMTKRAPQRHPAIRLLMENPHAIDRIVVQEGGIAQMALYQGDRILALLEIENTKKFEEALSIVTAHVSNAELDYSSDAKVFVYTDWKFWERF